MCFDWTASVIVESTENEDSGITTYSTTYPYIGYGNALAVNTTYKRLAYSDTGFNCYVTVRYELSGINNREEF